MNLPVVSLIESVSPQISELGSPARIFPDMVPQGQMLPAVVYSVISGVPENYLEAAPTLDSVIVQITIWAHTRASAGSIADRVRAALESGGKNCCIRLNPDYFEPESKRFSIGFDFEFWLSR